ncbi:MAG: hypothetical protein A2017_12805 [Lentisphaerae bacterium GWF2_44_16]|nr:MAG: hypothetical protein A2017_12805 [Lentisphaerae bacterium GWF2_44_16]
MSTEKTKLPIISASFLVLGNCLGVGVLALPVKTGLAGFVPALSAIILIWLTMLISALVIAYRIGSQEHFDIPSFYHQEIGHIGKWLAIICNLIILYGVLVAYLSGVSTLVISLFQISMPQWAVVFIYFCITTALIMFGMNALRKENVLIVTAIWISFGILIFTGVKKFDTHVLFSTYDWRYMSMGLPIAVSAFHFHNIIPTVCRAVKHDFRAASKAIFLGVFLGLIINTVWVIVVLGTLPESGPGIDTIYNASLKNWPATVPMSQLLHSKVFTTAGLAFAVLAVTASFMANGTGLFGFIGDLTHTYLKKDSALLTGALSFLPPLVITLIYPDIFLSALSMVGGIGETILFAILPAIILFKLSKNKFGYLAITGYIMFLIGLYVTLFVTGQKLGFIDLQPRPPQAVVAEK